MKLHEHTRIWWERVLAEDRVNVWLLRLHQAEVQGGERFRALISRWEPEGRALAVLEGIAEDETRHGAMVAETLVWRDIEAPSSWPPAPERYWDAVHAGVVDLATACAAAAFGEVLALNRFRVLIGHESTPADVRGLATRILPDEERHARDLRDLAGPDGMGRVRRHHRAGMAALGLGHVED